MDTEENQNRMRNRSRISFPKAQSDHTDTDTCIINTVACGRWAKVNLQGVSITSLLERLVMLKIQ